MTNVYHTTLIKCNVSVLATFHYYVTNNNKGFYTSIFQSIALGIQHWSKWTRYLLLRHCSHARETAIFPLNLFYINCFSFNKYLFCRENRFPGSLFLVMTDMFAKLKQWDILKLLIDGYPCS